MYLDVIKENQGGFNYDLCLRYVLIFLCFRNNKLINKNLVSKHKFTSTGTTICGILFKEIINL